MLYFQGFFEILDIAWPGTISILVLQGLSDSIWFKIGVPELALLDSTTMVFRGDSDQKRCPRIGTTRLCTMILVRSPIKNGVPGLAPLDSTTMIFRANAIKNCVEKLAPLQSTTMSFKISGESGHKQCPGVGANRLHP